MGTSWFGVATPGLPRDVAPFNDLVEKIGTHPQVAVFYKQWYWKAPFPAADCDVLLAGGSVPEVTWEPWNPAAGVNQPDYSLASIAAGKYDAYLTSWARDIAAWGKPIRIRLMHEMNGTWYPWCVGVNGNTAADYVAAWRHVRGLFAAVPNAQWVWCPNIGTPFNLMFPGSSMVDEVALDGYNGYGPWTSFEKLFGTDIDHLTRMTSRPISIGEMGCTEVGGDKAAWIDGMWSSLAARPRVNGVVWFNFAAAHDWRLETPPAALAAFKAGLPGYLHG